MKRDQYIFHLLNSLGFISILFMIAGCSVTFRSEMKGAFDSPSVFKPIAEKVSVLFVFYHLKQAHGSDTIQKLKEKDSDIRSFDDLFHDALSEFGNIKSYSTFTVLASDVVDPERRALKDTLESKNDFSIHIRLLKENSFAKHSLASVGSILTLKLLPVSYSWSYSIKVEVFDHDGRLIKNYDRSAKMTKWVQSLFVFWRPFHPEKRQKEDIYLEFLHDMFEQINAEGVLRKPK